MHWPISFPDRRWGRGLPLASLWPWMTLGPVPPRVARLLLILADLGLHLRDRECGHGTSTAAGAGAGGSDCGNGASPTVHWHLGHLKGRQVNITSINYHLDWMDKRKRTSMVSMILFMRPVFPFPWDIWQAVCHVNIYPVNVTAVTIIVGWFYSRDQYFLSNKHPPQALWGDKIFPMRSKCIKRLKGTLI